MGRGSTEPLPRGAVGHEPLTVQHAGSPLPSAPWPRDHSWTERWYSQGAESRVLLHTSDNACKRTWLSGPLGFFWGDLEPALPSPCSQGKELVPNLPKKP